MRECHANKAIEAGVQTSYVHSSKIAITETVIQGQSINVFNWPENSSGFPDIVLVNLWPLPRLVNGCHKTSKS